MKFTIGYINYDKEMFDKHLSKSLENLKGDFDIISYDSENFTSRTYNKIIEKSKNRYILFTHEDIMFKNNILFQLENTINLVQRFGVMGLAGKNNENKFIWSNTNDIFKLITVDCCFFLIDKENNIYFDETFNGLHMYGEDYAMTCINNGLNNYSILTNSHNGNLVDRDVAHYENSCRKFGSYWGEYNVYYDLFKKKWKK
jgi:hypothetical protein